MAISLQQLVELIEQYNELPTLTESELSSFRYLDNTGFDSFSLIHLIADIESEFGVELSAEDTESDQFRAIGSLLSLINEKLI
ncbi:phosphopantetheine-binding protein [Pseudoalteromonas sp. SS15]|uniref:phosphopantetheine-binding protein n=1 Tax=Pseudoalteromonas sp. SS15 TaxID=3139393 RepID=UPI003BAD5FDB